MAYLSTFNKNKAYDNTDINKTFSRIVGEGVSQVANDPNGILQAIAGTGVTLDLQKCGVIWGNNEKTQIKITDGTVIMQDGSRIDIGGAVVFALTANAKNYVYIENDPILQNVPKCTASLPQNPYVLLAEVENGIIIDKRIFSRSKIGTFGTNTSRIENVHLSWAGWQSSFDISKYSYLSARSEDGNSASCGIYDLKNLKCLYSVTSTGNSQRAYWYQNKDELFLGGDTYTSEGVVPAYRLKRVNDNIVITRGERGFSLDVTLIFS